MGVDVWVAVGAAVGTAVDVGDDVAEAVAVAVGTIVGCRRVGVAAGVCDGVIPAAGVNTVAVTGVLRTGVDVLSAMVGVTGRLGGEPQPVRASSTHKPAVTTERRAPRLAVCATRVGCVPIADVFNSSFTLRTGFRPTPAIRSFHSDPSLWAGCAGC